MSKEKITVTLDAELIRELNSIARTLHESRSHLVEEAVQAWRMKRLKSELARGYKEMAEENLKVAESSLRAAYEAIK